jgi:hypothetical protein
MYTFKDYIDDLAIEEEAINTDEALDVATRIKMKANMRRNKAKLALGRRKAAKRVANKEVIKKRADRQARKAVLQKILRGKDKGELTYGARAAAEKIVNKRQAMIRRLAKKLIPQVRKADRDKNKPSKES